MRAVTVSTEVRPLPGAVCDSLQSHLGSSHGVAVAKLVNYDDLSARVNLPATLLLIQRFFVAAGASRHDWVSFGSLSAGHVGFVLAPGSVDREWNLQEALDAFAVSDESFIGARLVMRGVGIALELSAFGSLHELFEAVDEALMKAEGPSRSANHVESWCP